MNTLMGFLYQDQNLIRAPHIRRVFDLSIQKPLFKQFEKIVT